MLGNLSVSYRIPFVLVTVVRSASLITNVAIGFFLLSKTYSIQEVVSVVVATVGVLTASLSSAPSSSWKTHSVVDDMFGNASMEYWILGFGSVVGAMVLGTILGFVQEDIYTRYPKNIWENMTMIVCDDIIFSCFFFVFLVFFSSSVFHRMRIVLLDCPSWRSHKIVVFI